jgi:hypothetical protein
MAHAGYSLSLQKLYMLPKGLIHKDQQLTPKGAVASVLPVDELWRIPYSDAL